MKSKKLTGIVTAAVLSSSVTLIGLGKPWLNARADPKPSVVNSPAGKPADGFQLTVTLQKQTMYIAEPLLLTVFLKNISNKPKNFVDSGIYKNFTFVVTDQKGVPAPQTLYGQSRLGGDSSNQVSMAGYRHLDMGQVLKYKILINALYDMTMGNTYHITVKQKSPDFTAGTEIVSNTVTVQNLGENAELLR